MPRRSFSTIARTLLLWGGVSGCAKPAPPASPVPSERGPLHEDATRGVADPTLQALLHDHWEDTMRRSPEWATQLGDRRYDARLADASEGATRDHFEMLRTFLARAEALPQDPLSPADQLTLAVFAETLRGELALEPCVFHRWSVSPGRNALADLARTIDDHPTDSAASLDALRSRVEQMPAAIDQEIDRLETGRTAGLTPGAEAVRRTLAYIDRTLEAPRDTSPLYAPGRDPIDGVDDARRADLAARHAEQVATVLLPAVERYRSYLADTLLPAGRPPAAATLAGLPDLPACYPSLVRRHTTLDLTPEEIHAVGLAEIARVHAEFMELAPRVFGASHPEATTDLAALFHHLRTAPELRFDSPEAIVATAEESLRAAEAAVPTAFETLPRTPCRVEPIPPHIAPFTYVAWYERPALGQDGIYRVNTYAPDTRLRHEARALAFHESVPGHHLQLARAQELPEVPAFRRHNSVTAFVEGWALYSERLADELGLYPSDLDRLGMLSFDAWRSARLVVDTGLHHYGWTREQAEAWMLDNTPLAENNITNEVDRYIGWPGQALGYKLGQRELRRLRTEAEAALGPRFSLPAFHTVVLDAGPVPLGVLEARVQAWQAALLAAPGADPQ